MDMHAKNEMEQVKRAVIKKYPLFGVTLFNVPIEENRNISTAQVVGEKIDGEIKLKGIEYNPDFFDRLSFDEKVFVLAHEASHIAFKHFLRGKDKEYKKIWNIATDACINAFLKNDGLNMPEGVIDPKTGKPMEFVDIADGLYRSAEVIYDRLVKKVEEKKRKKEDTQNSNQQKEDQGQGGQSGEENKGQEDQGEEQENNVGGGLDDIDIDNYQGIDSHENWEGEQREDTEQEGQNKGESKKSLMDKIKDMVGSDNKGEEKPDKKPQSKNLDNASDEAESNKPEDSEIDESDVFKKNSEKREELKKEALKRAFSNITEEAGCTHIKNEKPILSWKRILVRSVEEESERWGYRRANRLQPNMRIEDVTYDDRATTEVILDTSGSISDELLRGFLRQLVPLFKETDIKVGCFSGKFYDFEELKTKDQVEKFKAKRDSNGTNYEAAVTGFSRSNGTRINRIVFTDGELDWNSEHVQRTKVDGIIWIVFGDKMNFKPLGGKIIRVNDRDFKRMLNLEQDIGR